MWTTLFLLHHPDVKEKVRNEISRIVGYDRDVTLEDRPSMPYTNAVLHESLRKSSLVYFALPHFTTSKVTVENNLVIPANSMIFPNLHHVMHDEDYWKDPQIFNPDRFIDNDGKFKPSERVIPFSIGKRYCIGQSLAEKEYFLFFVTILQKFDISAEPDVPLPSYHDDHLKPVGLIRSPPPFKVVLNPVESR